MHINSSGNLHLSKREVRSNMFQPLHENENLDPDQLCSPHGWRWSGRKAKVSAPGAQGTLPQGSSISLANVWGWEHPEGRNFRRCPGNLHTVLLH